MLRIFLWNLLLPLTMFPDWLTKSVFSFTLLESLKLINVVKAKSNRMDKKLRKIR